MDKPQRKTIINLNRPNHDYYDADPMDKWCNQEKERNESEKRELMVALARAQGFLFNAPLEGVLDVYHHNESLLQKHGYYNG